MGHKIEQISLALTSHCFGILVELTIVSNSKGKFCCKHLENCAGKYSKICKKLQWKIQLTEILINGELHLILSTPEKHMKYAQFLREKLPFSLEIEQ